MREIKFRAKRIDNGEWLEGGILHQTDYYGDKVDKYFIIDGTYTVDYDIGEAFEVDENTVCQYTGLKDKNGKEIWENDIVCFQFDNDNCTLPYTDTKKRYGKIFFSDYRASFAIAMGRNGSKSMNNDLYKYVQCGNRVEVIGNIFDNPELLERGAE